MSFFGAEPARGYHQEFRPFTLSHWEADTQVILDAFNFSSDLHKISQSLLKTDMKPWALGNGKSYLLYDRAGRQKWGRFT